MSSVSSVEKLYEKTKGQKVKYKNIQVRVPEDLHKQFTDILPMQGGISWFVRTTMEAFVRQIADHPRDALLRTVAGMDKALTAGRKAVILKRNRSPAELKEKQKEKEE